MALTQFFGLNMANKRSFFYSKTTLLPMKNLCYKLLSTYTKKFLVDLYVRIANLSLFFPRISNIQTYTRGSSPCHTSRSKNGNEYKYARKKILATNESSMHLRGPCYFLGRMGVLDYFCCFQSVPMKFPLCSHQVFIEFLTFSSSS